MDIKCIVKKCMNNKLPSCYSCGTTSLYCSSDLLPEEKIYDKYICKYCLKNNEKYCITCLKENKIENREHCLFKNCQSISFECSNHSSERYCCINCSNIKCFKCLKYKLDNYSKCNNCYETYCFDHITGIDISPLTLAKFDKIQTSKIAIGRYIHLCGLCKGNKSTNDIQYDIWMKSHN